MLLPDVPAGTRCVDVLLLNGDIPTSKTLLLVLGKGEGEGGGEGGGGEREGEGKWKSIVQGKSPHYIIYTHLSGDPVSCTLSPLATAYWTHGVATVVALVAAVVIATLLP